jgi:hypothetical protein
MRAGTSRGPFFLREWLPEGDEARDQALIGAIGASDPLQLDVRRQAHGSLELELEFGGARFDTFGSEELPFGYTHPALNLIRCIATPHMSSPLQIAGLCE